MTRDELLHLASQWLFSKTRTRNLAARMTTSEAVELERMTATALASKAKLQSSRARWFIAGDVVGLILSMAALACRDYFPGVAEAGAAAGIVGMALLVGAIVRGCAADDKLVEAKATLTDLALVINSSDCKTAMEFVAGGQPAVLAWRDLAIAERGVLCAFDVQMMHELHHASNAVAKAAAVQRENERACRQLYGIADHEALPAELVKT